MVADLNLLGSVGDLYCFCNTLSMLVSIWISVINMRSSICDVLLNYFVSVYVNENLNSSIWEVD